MAETDWKSLLAASLVGVAAMISAMGLAMIHGVPPPRIHDEFAYLLQSDTFAHGRLANPPHPLAEFFDTFHVLQEPTYASKYPPAQGLFLALGQKVWHPVVGVWLSFGLLGAALTWMLRACVPLSWAVIATILVLIRILEGGEMTWNQWAYGYWGGSVAALGGCLVWGAGRRLYDRAAVVDSLVFGVGLGLLALSRPVEGFLTALPVTLVLLWRYMTSGSGQSVSERARGVLPAVAVLVLVGVWLGVYNQAVTGCWYRMPHQIHSQKTLAIPMFLWQKATPEPEYSDEALRRFYVGWDKDWWLKGRARWLFYMGKRVEMVYQYYLGLLLLPFWLLGVYRKELWPLLALATEAVMLIFLLQTSWCQVHYFAPVLGLLTYQIARGMQWCWERPGLLSMPFKVLVGSTVGIYLLVGTMIYVRPHETREDEWPNNRAAILRSLEQQGGKHLVLVRYSDRHNPLEEWVNNGADLEDAPVIWARMKSEIQMKKILAHYATRKIWLVDPDEPDDSVRFRPLKKEGP